MFTSALPGPAIIPCSTCFHPLTKTSPKPASNNGVGGLFIECSSRPQKKATAHHMRSRPKKSQPWDVKRKPTVYAPLPPLPPDWTLDSSASSSAEGAESASGSAAADSMASNG